MHPPPFKCPHCSCQFYGPVVVSNRDGSPYRSELLHCLGCSAVFLEPELFTTASSVAAEFPALVTPMAHEIGLRQQSLAWRYWRARLKRKSGMTMEPTSEQVGVFMQRMERY